MYRVNFYFDGFNFYNGLKAKSKQSPHWRNYYWLNFVEFCNQFVDPSIQKIGKVKYFTAPPKNIGKLKRQQVLLNANKALNPDIFEVINGKYINKQILCKNCLNVNVQAEEKRTDVNLSLELIVDCYEDTVDKLVIITADSDIIPPIQRILKNFPEKKISVLFPPERFSYDLKNIAKKPILLDKNENKFLRSVLPDELKIENYLYSKPENWKA